MAETKKARNESFNKARVAKNDEYYTREEDIENELRHYRKHFLGATVYCNCDDPTVSGFWQYFTRNFKFLGLKRLITTCFQSKDPFGWTRYKDKNGARIDFDGKRKTKKLRGDGDFRSAECVRILREADVVVTNPPFSLFREYVAQLIAEDKRFLIIGNLGAVGYKEIFRLFMAGKLWIGNKPMGVDMLFNVPHHFAEWLRANKREGSGYRIVNDILLGRSPAIWYTNLDHEKRHKNLELRARYGDGSAYPKYDNYDAIEIGEVASIPCDYAGVMGVPVSFLDKWNPRQFEMIGSDYQVLTGELKHLANPAWNGKLDRGYIGGNRKYNRIFIRNKEPKK